MIPPLNNVRVFYNLQISDPDFNNSTLEVNIIQLILQYVMDYFRIFSRIGAITA